MPPPPRSSRSPRFLRERGSTPWPTRSTSTGAGSTFPARRVRARRAGALGDFTGEFGERGLRRLGGRRAAEDWLAGQPDGGDVPALVAALAARAGLDG